MIILRVVHIRYVVVSSFYTYGKKVLYELGLSNCLLSILFSYFSIFSVLIVYNFWLCFTMCISLSARSLPCISVNSVQFLLYLFVFYILSMILICLYLPSHVYFHVDQEDDGDNTGDAGADDKSDDNDESSSEDNMSDIEDDEDDDNDSAAVADSDVNDADVKGDLFFENTEPPSKKRVRFAESIETEKAPAAQSPTVMVSILYCIGFIIILA